MQNILCVNLTNRSVEPFQIPEDWERQYLGGSSLAARILYSSLSKRLNPLSAEASILFINGPLSGTSGPATGRFVVAGKSPATGLWAESNCGGYWGYELRKTGYDGVWITGQADQPLYLEITDHQVVFHSAANIWGQDTYRTQQLIQEELPSRGYRVAAIGLAGELQIPFSAILADHGRLAGRTGLGAVMGAKKLKAIAVRGSREIPVFDPGGYRILRTNANSALAKDAPSLVMKEMGTASIVDYFDYLGFMPKKYYQKSHVDGIDRISGARIAETLLVGHSSCHACVISCGRVVQLGDGEKRKGPEYETLVGFGPNLLITDPVEITKLGEWCDRYGLDTISTSNTIGLAFTLFERGVISIQDTGRLELAWGDPQVVEQIIHQTAHRQGFGQLIALGAKDLAAHFGCAEEAMQVNGLEVAYHDPRGASGMALVYATSPRGACHNQSDYFLAEIGQVETSLGMQKFSPTAGAEKARNVAIHQNWKSVYNSLVMCLFAEMAPETILDLIRHACGYTWDIPEMLKCGERGWNLKRVINHRLGLSRQDDRLPKAFLTPYYNQPGEKQAGGLEFESMLAAYYQARGWDPKTGIPTNEKLDELDLEWTRIDLQQTNRELGGN